MMLIKLLTSSWINLMSWLPTYILVILLSAGENIKDVYLMWITLSTIPIKSILNPVLLGIFLHKTKTKYERGV